MIELGTIIDIFVAGIVGVIFLPLFLIKYIT